MDISLATGADAVSSAPTPAAKNEPLTGAALIGVKAKPSGLMRLQEWAMEARAYHQLAPYPLYHFRDWKTEDRGPLPRCLPLARSIVRRGAKWLFGTALPPTCAGNAKLETMIQNAWKGERLASRLVAMAEKAALNGGIVLKYSYDEKRPQPLLIQALSLVDEARLYYDPHDWERLLMARIQYSYFDPVQGKTFWYREEWTDEEEVHYRPLEASALGVGMAARDPDEFEGWIIESREVNPFGAIPVQHIKNIETDDAWGAGDCWDLLRVIDRINLTFHLMDRSNQFDSEINPYLIDLDADLQDLEKPAKPGEAISLESKEGDKQGKVAFPEARGSLRPAMMEYAKELTKQVLDGASSVQVDQADFTNVGNLTPAVLAQLYQPLIEATDEKRKLWGEGGLCLFFEKAAQGAARAGASLGVTDNPESYACSMAWPAYFQQSEDEKTSLVKRTQAEVQAGYLTHERAIERVAGANDITDVKALKEQLPKEPPPPPMMKADAPSQGNQPQNSQGDKEQ